MLLTKNSTVKQVLHSPAAVRRWAPELLESPYLFHAEALSGFLNGGHMVFPSGTVGRVGPSG